MTPHQPQNSEELATDLEKTPFKWLSNLPIIIPVILLVVVYGVIYLFNNHFDSDSIKQVASKISFTNEIWAYIGAGFLAQMVDGAMGMAYGITCNSLLLSLGVPPAAASASIHVAEVFTTGISGLSHLKLGNVNKKLFRNLVIPGSIGAVTGAYILSNIDGNIIKPYLAVYMLIMGFVVIRKAFARKKKKEKTTWLNPLAFVGGLVDAIGGGGWGPIVTSTLIGRGRHPRYTIGSVNLAEFFVAFSGAGMFVFLIGLDNYQVIAGLILGGMVAAPIAAYLTNKVNIKALMIIVGSLIVFLSIRTILKAWL